MSNELLASKVVVFEEEPKVRGVASAPTAVVGAVGLAADGPFDTAVLCNSFDEYQETFGGITASSTLSLAVMGFFENGGSQIWCSRVNPGSPSKASVIINKTTYPDALAGTVVSSVAPPFDLEVYDSLSIQVVTPTGTYPYTLSFEGYPARLIAGADGPYALADNQTLTLLVNGESHTVTFTTGQFVDIAEATAEEVVDAINAAIPSVEATVYGGTSVLISTRRLGTSASLQATAGTATALGFVGSASSGSGSVADIDAVTASDVQAMLVGLGASTIVAAADVTDPAPGMSLATVGFGSGYSIQVSGSAATTMGFDNGVHTGVSGTALVLEAFKLEAIEAGDAGNSLTAEVYFPQNYGAQAFDLQIRGPNGLDETFNSLTRIPGDARYIEDIVNDPTTGSQAVRATNNLVNNPGLRADFNSNDPKPFTGGSDGGISDADFIGTESNKRGLYSLDNVQDLSILIVPGRATSAVHNAMLTYCEQHRDGTAFAILDPPAGMSADDIVTYVSTTASLENASEYGAIYWPRVRVSNPNKSLFGPGSTIVVPPSGILAGVYARTDGASPGGVYVPPAGIEAGRLFGVLGFETEETLDERKRDIVYPHRINPLTTSPGLPKYIDGSRTLKGSGSFPFIAERRGVIFIERSLKQGLQFARHKNNTAELRAQVRRTITAFLLAQMNNGAFASKEPSKAFFVDVSDQLNTPSVITAGKLIARVGLATNKPAEYVILQISQDTRALEAELAAAG
jgi:phage tail sheath protein FI